VIYLPRNDRDNDSRQENKEKESNHVIPILQKVCRIEKGIRELAARSRRPRPFRKSLEIAVNEPAIRYAWKINDERPLLDLRFIFRLSFFPLIFSIKIWKSLNKGNVNIIRNI